MLKNIKIENFKCFENEKLDLKPLTLITGTNSSGKSSLLQAILLLGDHKDLEITKYLQSLGDFDDLKNKYINPTAFYINAEFNDKQVVALNYSKHSEALDNPAGKLSFPSDLTYLNANRQVFKELQAVVPSTKEERKFGISGEYITVYFDRFKDEPIEEDLITKTAPSYTLEGQTNYWLNRITSYSYELHTESSGSSHVRSFYKNDEGLTFKPCNIGTGISFLSSIIIACLSAKPNNIIIIENPEIHLHPQSQSNLAGFFAFIASKGIQLIIETHNDHLINRIRYEVFKENINSKDVIIHYKNHKASFEQISINNKGMFVDKNKENSFPKGFYDATLQEIFTINRGD